MDIKPTEVKHYKVLTAGSAEELQEKVNSNLEAGFYPVGGVSVSQDSYSYENERKGYTETQIDVLFAQAVVSLHDV